jgi:hypothetical protein
VRERGDDGRLFLRRRFFDPVHGPDGWRRQLLAGEVVKGGRRGRVVRCPLGVGKLRGEAAALAAWRAAFALELRGIAAPRALAFFAEPPGRAWVLSEDLAAALPLSRLVAAPLAARAPVSASLAEGLARLHATGWRCRDPKGDNLAALEGRAVFLDLDGVRPLPRWRRERACANDLSRLLAWARWQAPAAPLAGWPAIERRFLTRYLRTRQAIAGGHLDRARFVAAIERSAALWRQRHAASRFAE